MALWKRVRFGIEWFALMVAAKLVPLLPREVCFQLAQIFGALAARLDRHGRRIALANLEVAFGDEFSESKREEIVRESFRHFARTMIDLLWSPRLTAKNYRDFIDIENGEILLSESARKNGVIFACCHYGNFEWMSHACGFAGVKSDVMAQQFKNPWLDPIFTRLREVSGHKVVARKGGIGRLYKTLRRGGCTALLVDLAVKAGSETVSITSLGLEKSVTVALAWLAQRTGADIVPAHCEPLPHGRHRLVFHPKIELQAGATHQQIAQACWDVFEPQVRRNPAPWLWMYKHWRYRPADATRPYPFYAGFSYAFQEMLARSGSIAEDSAPASPDTFG